MEAVFIKLLNMSITAGWMVLAVILLRLIFKKAPKAIMCVCWALVGIRLIFPFSFESVLSLIPSTETVPQDIVYSAAPSINSGINVLNHAINPIISETFAPSASDSVNPMQLISRVASIAWAVGLVLMLLYMVISYLRVHNKAKVSAPIKDRIYVSDNISTPFILGFFRPRIYIPSFMNESEISYVTAHEKAHISRGDHFWKPIGFILLSVYWFNPLLWVAYILLCRDIEYACDEKVIKTMSADDKRAYSNVLLGCSVPSRSISACPLAFAEVGVKERIKSVLNYKRPAFWIIIVAVVACIVTAVCFLTNPKDNEEAKTTDSGSELEGVSVELVSTEFSVLSPKLIIRWHNTGDEPICPESRYFIYRDIKGKWTDTAVDGACEIDYTYYVAPGEYAEIEYSLKNNSLTGAGKYRFETYVNIYGEEDFSYKVFVEFELASSLENPLYVAHYFKALDLVYSNGMYSYVQTAEDAPQYRLSKDMLLQEMGKNENEWYDIGVMKEVDLTEEKYQHILVIDRISTPEGGPIDEIIKDNLTAWQVTSELVEGVEELYILLEQKDGTYYLAYGYTGDKVMYNFTGSGATVRWLYLLDNIEEDEVTTVNREFNTGSIVFYREPTEENKNPSIDVYCELRQSEIDVILYVLNDVKAWTDDYIVDRLSFKFDGYIALSKERSSEDEVVIYFGYDQLVLYYDHYFCEISETDMDIIKEYAVYKPSSPTVSLTEYESSVSRVYPKDSLPPDGVLNNYKGNLDAIKHQPIYKFETLEELDRFKDSFNGDLSDFEKATSNYGGDFFKENTLLMVYVYSPGSSAAFDVESVWIYNYELIVHVQGRESSDSADEMSYWMVTVALPNKDIGDCSGFDAIEVNALTVTHEYRYQTQLEPLPLKVLLWNNGTFLFNYSYFSSYAASGHYDFSSDTLTLRTDDGMNVYVFKVVDDGIAFDESRSSPIPKYKYSSNATELQCPVPDGTVFRLMP